MEQIQERMIKSYKNRNIGEDLSYIVKGFDVDYDNKVISLFDSDFSFIKKIHNQHIDLTIVSLFEQEFVDSMEQNPIVCSLKEKYGWKFDISDEQIVQCIDKAMSKFSCLNKNFDTFVSVYPKSLTIKRFIDIAKSKIHHKESMSDIFGKQSFDYEDLCVLVDWDTLYKKYGREIAIKISNEMEDNLWRQSKKYKYFKAKDFPKEYLKYLYCCKGTNENGKDFVSLIMDKDIVLFVDSRTHQFITLEDAYAINRNFCPKSITVIRVF